MLYAELLLFGMCVGVVSGLLGIGGGIVLVPGLMLLFHFSQQEAQGTSLAALTPPIFLFAAIVYYRYGYVRIPCGASVALGLMIGAYCGARLVPHLPVQWLGLAFGGLLLYVGFRYVFGPYMPRYAAALPAGLAIILTVIGAWLRGRKIGAARSLAPPGENIQYHI